MPGALIFVTGVLVYADRDQEQNWIVKLKNQEHIYDQSILELD